MDTGVRQIWAAILILAVALLLILEMALTISTSSPCLGLHCGGWTAQCLQCDRRPGNGRNSHPRPSANDVPGERGADWTMSSVEGAAAQGAPKMPEGTPTTSPLWLPWAVFGMLQNQQRFVPWHFLNKQTGKQCSTPTCVSRDWTYANRISSPVLERDAESDHSTLHTHNNKQGISKLIIYASLEENGYTFLCCDFNSKDTQ